MDIDIAGKLFPNLATIVVQLSATTVMLLIFKKFFWKRLQDYFAKRANYIESTITDANKLQETAKVLVVESEKQSREAALEYHNIIEKAKEDANIARDQILAETNKEVKAKLEQASLEIAAEKKAATRQMKEEIVDIAIEVATKVLKKDMDNEKNISLVQDFVDEMVN